jgi:putative endonuclease
VEEEKDRRKDLGRWGEEIACRYLLQKGYRLLARNYRTKNGEIDLIMFQDPYYIFVEVKTRKGNPFGEGSESITVQKQKRIRTVALQYLKTRPFSTGYFRFDVVLITCKKNFLSHISHIENAF